MLDRRTVLAGSAILTSASGIVACESDGPTPASSVRFEGGKRLLADVVVYGATPAGIVAAAEASDAGCSVVVLGGWRERHLGGMMSGGLGLTDFRDPDAIGGRGRRLLDAIANRQVGSRFAFDPANAERAFEGILARRSIPVIWTDGVSGVEIDAGVISAISTTDGLKALGRIFIDASYEGDLAALSGVEMVVGREAADGKNPENGYGAVEPKSANQFALGGRAFQIDPYAEPGGRDLLPGIRSCTGRPGEADRAVQAYNFRLTMTETAEMRRDLSAAPPHGYDPGNYEALLRLFDSARRGGLRYGEDWSLSTDLLKISPLGGGLLDINSKGPLSTDWIGGSWSYPLAGYDERRKIWKAHETYTRGLLYILSHGQDPRIPQGLKTEAGRLGLSRNNYMQPVPGDDAGWPYQLYVRESRRLVGDTVWTAADLDASERGGDRYAKPIAVTSYGYDCHPVQRLAVAVDRGGCRIVNEGGIGVPIGDRHRSLLAFEIVCPRRTECSNLLVPFCVSATHNAFAAIRIETTAMALGQACGAAAALAIKYSLPAVHDVPYLELRRRLLAGGQVLTSWVPIDSVLSALKRRLLLKNVSTL